MCLDSRHNPPPFKKKRIRPQSNKTNVQSPYWLNPDHQQKTTAKQHLTHPLAWRSRRTPTFRFVAIALANSVELAPDAATSICVKISHVFNLIHGDMPTVESLMKAIPWSKWLPLCPRMTCTVDMVLKISLVIQKSVSLCICLYQCHGLAIMTRWSYWEETWCYSSKADSKIKLLTEENCKPKDFIAYVHRWLSYQRQVRVGLHCQARCASTKTVQLKGSQPLDNQNESSHVRACMPSDSQIQWVATKHEKWNGKPRPACDGV